MYITYNLISLVLGLLALGTAIHSIRVRFCPFCCILSFSCCGISLFSQLLEIRRRVIANDWSALLDTMDAVIFAAATLLTMMILLNVLALIRKRT